VKPAGGDEKTVDLAHLRDPALMRAYWADVRLFFERARGSKTVLLHVEPDLWGYVEHAGAVSLARSFAQQFVRLRDQLAPNVLLAYHRSGWGTKHDIVYEKPPNAVVERYAAQSAAFYRSLHAKFGVAFEDFSDRDAGFYQVQQGEREDALTWPARCRRRDRSRPACVGRRPTARGAWTAHEAHRASTAPRTGPRARDRSTALHLRA